MSIDKYIEFNFSTIAPNTLLNSAIALIAQNQAENKLGCLLIVVANKLIGILTQSDVVRLVASQTNLATTTVEQVMTQPVLTILRSQCHNLYTVWSFCQQHSISYLPIEEGEQLIGVIGVRSLMPYFPPTKQYRSNAYTVDPNQNKELPNGLSDRHQILTENKQELARFFETASIQCIVGFDSYFVRTNATLSQTLGFTPDELIAQPFINFVHPDDRAATIAELGNLMTGKTTISFENRYRTKDGNYRWLLWTANPYIAEKLIYAAARDITERKLSELALAKSEAKLSRSENLLRTIVESEPECVKLIQQDGTLIDINPAGLAMIEADSPEQILGQSVFSLVDPQHRQAFIELTQSVFAGKSAKLEFILNGLKGTSRWLETHVVPFRDEEQITALLAVTRDISQRKQAEIQLQQERDFSEAVINTVGALVAVLDRQGTIVSFNHTCEQVTGYYFEEVQNKQVWDFLIPPQEKATVKAVFERLLAGQFHNQYENYWIAKDGTQHLISWSNTALFDAQGEVEFIIATGIDVTEQRRVWNKLELQYRQNKLLTDITRKIRMSIELEAILQTAVTEVQHLLACDRVLIMKLKPNHNALPISEALLPDLPTMLGYEIADPLLQGEYLARYRQGKVLAIDDLATAAIDLDIKQLLQQFQIQAKLVIPILAQGQLQGLLVAHQCHHPRQWQKSEIQLLNQLGDQIGVALSQAQLLNYTEQLVEERTKELTATNELLKLEIVERKQTEQELRENQQKLAGILDNADEAIISINEQQQIQLFNQGAEKIFGYQATEIMGQSLDILLPQAFRQVHRHHIKQFAELPEKSRQMTDRNSNVYGRHKDGHEFPAEASVAKLQTKAGMFFTVMLKDISERQQTQEKLQTSQSLLVKAEKIAKIGSWEYDHETNRKSWSEELFAILGFAKQYPVPPPCQEILERVHPEDLLLVKKTLRAGHQQGTAWELNYRLLFPDGTIKYIESRGEPTVNSAGKVLKVLETIMDVSERIQAEQSLQRSENQLKLITDALPVLIAYIDARQRYIYNNRTYESWYGKPRSSLQGKLIKEVVGEHNYQQMLPYIKTALAGKTVTFESQPIADGGNFYWMNATFVPDFNSHGEVKGFFSMIEDITERKAIEQMKSEFISIASHEMRTPLTAIHGVMKLLSAGRLGELSESGAKMADMALRNSDRLVRLVNDILDLERMESGRDELNPQPCDSAELIQQAIETTISIADEQGINLQADAQSLKFLGDRDRLVQTLNNLISNAIKFSSAHSNICISSKLDQQNILFSVKDQGRGIPKNKLETIFERFQQVDASDSRQKGGTGLGLAICRHIVEQHQGKIWVESVYGQGSTFFFSIPQ